MNNCLGWLTTCPASDINFKSNLKRATAAEVREALKIIEGKPGTKTKEKLLQAALKKKEAKTALEGGEHEAD